MPSYLVKKRLCVIYFASKPAKSVHKFLKMTGFTWQNRDCTEYAGLLWKSDVYEINSITGRQPLFNPKRIIPGLKPSFIIHFQELPKNEKLLKYLEILNFRWWNQNSVLGCFETSNEFALSELEKQVRGLTEVKFKINKIHSLRDLWNNVAQQETFAESGFQYVQWEPPVEPSLHHYEESTAPTRSEFYYSEEEEEEQQEEEEEEKLEDYEKQPKNAILELKDQHLEAHAFDLEVSLTKNNLNEIEVSSVTRRSNPHLHFFDNKIEQQLLEAAQWLPEGMNMNFSFNTNVNQEVRTARIYLNVTKWDESRKDIIGSIFEKMDRLHINTSTPGLVFPWILQFPNLQILEVETPQMTGEVNCDLHNIAIDLSQVDKIADFNDNLEIRFYEVPYDSDGNKDLRRYMAYIYEKFKDKNQLGKLTITETGLSIKGKAARDYRNLNK